MKKNIYMIMAAAAILTGCQNDDIIEGGGSNDNLKMVEITAGMPGNDGSRTAFIDGGVKWQANDALSVFVGEQNYKFTIEDGIGENEATFLGEVPASADFTNNVAYYPYGENVSIAQAEGKYTVSAQYPVVQQWAADGSFGPNSLPMIAQNGTQNSDKYNFNFKTLGGWLQLYVKGTAKISKVVMKAEGHKIAGDYTVTAAFGTTPTVAMAEEAVSEITLNCAEAVQLSAEDATLFTFAVAPFTFEAGQVSFDIYDNQGGIMQNAYVIAKGGTVIANAYYTLSKNNAVTYAANAQVEGYKAPGVIFHEEENVYEISTKEGLRWVADVVNATTPYTPTIFDEAVVKLTNNIDLENEEWIPIGDDRSQRTEFHGTFDGQGYTVSNVKITKKTDREDENKSSYGLFGNLKGTVKNLTVKNVSISGAPKFIGALVGRINDGLIENCHVKSSSVECNNWTIGGLVGQWNNGKISGCSVEGTTITGYAGVGAIAGLALNKGERVMENCSVKNVTIVQNGAFGGNYDKMFGSLIGALYSGELTVNVNNCSVENTTIKDEASSVLVGHIKEGDKLLIDGNIFITDGLLQSSDEKTYVVTNANGLVYLQQNISIIGGMNISLGADIDLEGVEFNGLSAHNPENPNTFDGQEYTVSNWTYEGGASDMGFIKGWTGTIKNVNFENCHLKTAGRSAVVAGKVYANIENVHVNNSSIEDSYWACGIIAGLYNSGSVSNCSVTNSSVKSNGGTAAIVGVVNESAGERKIENCKVEGTTVNNTAMYGEAYPAALFVGKFNVNGATYRFNECTFSDNTVEGGFVENGLFYSKNVDGKNIFIDGEKVYFSIPKEITLDNSIVELVGFSADYGMTVSGTGTIVLDAITMNAAEGAAITLAEGANVTLKIVNDVTLTGATDGIKVPNGATLVVDGEGNLNVVGTNGSGIGAAGKEVGAIIVKNIAGITAKGNGDHAFGIGGNGANANVTIENTKVDYVCGGHIQPLCVNDPKYGKSEPEGGAAIGGAKVKITDATVTKAEGGSKAAAIGAQYHQSTEIEIINSTIVEANGGNASAGIGGSRYGSDSKHNVSIKIQNSNVIATGGQFGAGIGAGYDTHCNGNNYTAINYIEIDATSIITAKGGKYAPGIGTGYHSAYLSGSIAEGAVVNAEAGDETFYKNTYTTAQNIGYGVVDPAREFSGVNAKVTFTVGGKLIEHPTGYANLEEGAFIYNAKGMQWFANEVNVNRNAFSGKTVKLEDDINLAGIDWEPIGQTGATTFNGIFDGQNHTISNLIVNSDAETGAY